MTLTDCLITIFAYSLAPLVIIFTTCACGLAPLVIVFAIRGIAGYKPE